MRTPRTAFGPAFSPAKYAAPLSSSAIGLTLLHGLARARQEHVEDRQGAADLARLQIGLHLLGDEEAEAQDRTQRALDIVERGRDAAARQSRQVGHRADRLERAQHVGRRLGIERVRVEKVRAGEHVEHGRLAAPPDWCPPRRGSATSGAARAARTRCRRIWRGVARPAPWSAASAANPPTASCRREISRCRPRLRFAARTRQRGREQHDGSERRNSQGMQHVHSRPEDAAAGP